MVAPAVAAYQEAMLEVGNASSLHTFGRDARRKVEEAREEIARVAHCKANEVIFTASGTESNNLAIKGLYWNAIASDDARKVILISAIEHHAVMDPAEWLVEHEGAELISIPVYEDGTVNLDFLASVVAKRKNEIALIAVMHSNNEVGTIQPIAEVVEIAGDIPVHTDAVQSYTKVPFNFAKLGPTTATISGHKIGGPYGVAALIVKHGLDITPILHGGGQERDIRSGTLNVPGIIAFAAAANYSDSQRQLNSEKVQELKSALQSEILATVPDARFNGHGLDLLPGILNVTFPGTESDGLLLLLDGEEIATSTGSACSAGVQQASHVLIAMGLSARDARSSLRFSLSPSNTLADIKALGKVIAGVVAKSRASMGYK